MTDTNKRIAALPPEQREVILRQLRQKAVRNPLAQSIPVQPRTASSHALSFAQQRLWFLDQLEPGSPLYNVPAAVWLEGKLDVAALERSFGELMRRHESLRTTFHPGENGPIQRLAPAVPAAMPVVSLESLPAEAREAEALRLATEEALRTFDLGQGPLWRTRLLRLDAERHLLVVVMHHIISDGWSVGVLVREMAMLYAAYAANRPSPLPEPALHYVDFSAWQHERLQGELLETQLSYWRKQLEDAPEALDLATDRPRPVVRNFKGARTALVLPPALSEALKTFSQREGVTPFMTLLAAFQVLLSRYSGQEDVCVGSPVAGRTRAELEGMIGCFINTLVLRARPAGELSFRELVQQVREVTLGAFAHQEVPFEKLVDALRPERRLDRSPLFQHMFILQNAPMPPLELAGLKLRTVELESHTSRFDLTMSLAETAQGFAGELHYSTELFEARTVERLCEHYRVLLEGVLAQPSRKLGEVSLLTQDERLHLVQHCNQTQRDYPRTTVHEAFQAQVALRPDSIALESADSSLTFRQLDERANQLAHLLRHLGVRPESRVALCLPRSLELIVSLLGILKAGGAYVPLDPDYPRERLAHMLEDARPQVLLTSRSLLPSLPSDGLSTLLLEEAPLHSQPSSAPLSGACPDNLVYIDFTSGSTGRPKGVCIQHASVLRTVLGVDYAHLSHEHSFLLLAPISFDASTLEVWGSLLNGARLVLFPPHPPGDVQELEDILLRHRVSTLHLTSGLFTQMVDSNLHGLRSVRQLLTGGDVVSPPHVRRVLDSLHIPVTACYGPTENTLFSTCHRMTDSSPPGASVPIGRPISNSQAYVLDRFLQPVPVGVPGELFVSGDGLARGYLESPSLSAEKFLPNPFSSSPGARMYRTGDRARWRHDGLLEFLGRGDNQVKMRGFRVELSEVVSALRSHPSVRDALVLALGDSSHKRLVAYVLSPDADSSSLRAFLKQRLPEYMVPSSFLRLDSFPLTPNGKLDRKALPLPDSSRPELALPYAPPSNPLEEKLASLWAQVLRLQRVGIHDNFFELGGDSILSLQLISRSRAAGLHFTPKHLFQHQTVASLASVVTSALQSCDEQGVVRGPVPLTPVQREFFSWTLPTPHHFNQALLLEARGGVDVARVEQALLKLWEHHDALRMRFIRSEAGWTQENTGLEARPSLRRMDLSGVSDAELPAAIETEAARVQASFDLGEGLLLRAAFFDLGADRPGRLLVVIHHLAVDAVSWRVLLEDFETAYQQLGRGEPVELPPKTTSFKAWAEKLQAHARSEALEGELAHWTAEARQGVRALPVDRAGGENTLASERRVTVSLDGEETRALLREVPAAYQARIDEVLLTALARSLSKWTSGERVLVDVEGHGREELFPGVDLSRTVGWFTAVAPVLLEASGSSSPGEVLRSVRGVLRQLPARGIGHGLLRWMGSDEVRARLGAMPRAQVAFNYLGQLDAMASGSSLFGPARESAGPTQGGQGGRRYLIEVSGHVLGGRLELSWTYSEALHARPTIEALAQECLTALRALVAGRASPDALRYTPADFPLARLEQAAFERVLPRGEPVEDLYPLAPLQQGMLFQSLLSPGSSAYFEQLVWSIHSRLDLAAFRRAWDALVERHAILRTSLRWEELAEPLQVVHARPVLPWREHDWRGLSEAEQQTRLQAFLEEDRARGFALDRAPLMRLAVMRLGENVHRFVWSFHHILLDGWSMGLVLGELFALYGAFERGQAARLAPAPAFRDYIAWLGAQEPSRAESFWRGTLGDFSTPTPLPGDRKPGRSDLTAYSLGKTQLVLSEASTEALQDFARRNQLTLNTVVQGAWALLLSRYSGEQDVVFGATVAGRPAELAGSDAMVGMFINSLPVRVRVRPTDRLVPWLQELQAAQAEQRQFEHSPLVRVQGFSGVPRGSPLFESILVFENYPMDASITERANGLDVRDVQFLERRLYPLNFTFFPGRKLEVLLSYDEVRFDAATAESLMGHWRVVLDEMVARSGQPLAELQILTPAEQRQLLLEWNDTSADFPREAVVHELFEAAAARVPDAVAVLFNGERLSFGELNRRSNQLAHHLRARGVGPDVQVGLYVERSPELVVGLLGILKAGGAYVPLDPSYPMTRLAFMLEDSRIPVLVTQRRLAEGLPPLGARVLCLDTDRALLDGEPEGNPGRTAAAENLAYVIYTSGSTGTPKGVLIDHRGVVNYLSWCARTYPVDEGTGAPVHSSLAFDLTVTSLVLPLVSGRPVVLVPGDERVEGLGETLRAGRDFSLVKLTPSHLQLLSRQLEKEEAAGRTRAFVIGGEALTAESLAFWREHAPGTRLINEYGPTETVVGCCVHEVSAEDPSEGPVSIGRPIANVALHVLDRELRLVPVGVPGELYIGGMPLARGYWHRPELTAERFVPNPFSAEPGARLYRTGDLVRRLADGRLEYLGRLDTQVKVRGYRIELGEIESVLVTHPSVREAVVVALDSASGSKRLVAYVTGEPELDTATLRTFLARSLPEYMVPSFFVSLGTFPLSPNGKIDRKALPAPDYTPKRTREYVAPRTDTEQRLAKIWSDVLGQPRIDVHDSFFELGGDSLTSVRIAARATQQGLPLQVQQIFQYKTLEQIAAAIDQGLSAPRAAPSTRDSDVDEELPILPQQQWLVQTFDVETQIWANILGWDLPGNTSLEALKASLAFLVQRHDVLRMRLRRTGEGWGLLMLASAGEPAVTGLDLSGLEPQEQREEIIQAASRLLMSLSITRGPVLALTLCHLGHQRPDKLLLSIHHSVYDAYSLPLLLEDLHRTYVRLAANEPPPLLEVSASYRQYIEAMADHRNSEAMRRDSDFWLSAPHLRPHERIPVDFEGGIHTDLNSRRVTLQIPSGLADRLLNFIRSSPGVTFNELLLYGVARAWSGWAGPRVLSMDVENNGRGGVLKNVDLSRTIGPTTIKVPIRFDVPATLPPGAAFEATRNIVRETMSHVVGYGLLRFGPDPSVSQRLAACGSPQVFFNNLGAALTGSQQAAPPKISGESFSLKRPDGTANIISYDLMIECDGVGSDFQMSWVYSAEIHRDETIHNLARGVFDALAELSG